MKMKGKKKVDMIQFALRIKLFDYLLKLIGIEFFIA